MNIHLLRNGAVDFRAGFVGQPLTATIIVKEAAGRRDISALGCAQ